ncbi:MAG TPA: hypothetical protein VMF87_35250, partial [Streptosporangiaceae bacterium]|nr:hypothetical protein [Streptosporangiaceae bacterium]
GAPSGGPRQRNPAALARIPVGAAPIGSSARMRDACTHDGPCRQAAEMETPLARPALRRS